jgi:hypothetical protein
MPRSVPLRAPKQKWAMQLRLCEDLNRFEGDLLRLERIEAGTQLRLDRIETRLSLTDA